MKDSDLIDMAFSKKRGLLAVCEGRETNMQEKGLHSGRRRWEVDNYFDDFFFSTLVVSGVMGAIFVVSGWKC